MKPKIIGITGKIGSGKSTVAKYIAEKHGYEEYSFAKPLKDIASVFGFTNKQLYGSQEDKLEIHSLWGVSAREFLQKFGCFCRDNISQFLPNVKSIWLDLFKIKLEENKNFVVSDVRFLNEAELIRKQGGIIIRTVRNFNKAEADEKIDTHKSETEQESIISDYCLDNSIFTINEVEKLIDAIFQLEAKKAGNDF